MNGKKELNKKRLKEEKNRKERNEKVRGKKKEIYIIQQIAYNKSN